MTILLLIPSLLIDWYIWRRCPRRATLRGHEWRPRKWYAWSVILTILPLVLAMLWPKRTAMANLVPVMWCLVAWVSVYLSKFIYLIFDLIGRIPRLWKGRTWKLGKYVGLPLAVVLFVLIWWSALFTRSSVQVSQVEIVSEKLPPAFDGFTIAQFSDAHVGSWGTDTTFISKFVNEINALHPDLIVFTGDIVNRSTDEIYPFIKPLSRLKAPMGVYSIMGNHDYGDYADWPTEEEHLAQARELREIERKMGWHMLDNETDWIRLDGDSIALIGVENWGEPPFTRYGSLPDAYPQNAEGRVQDANYKILLSHNPMHWHEEVRTNTDIDLTLAGHTHAMQVMFGAPGTGFSPSQYRYPEWGGLYEYRNTLGASPRLYVNIGSGTVAFPARIGSAAPEITLITLKRPN